MPKMYQAHDSALGEAVPETPLRVLDLSQRMAPKSTIGKAVYALRELVEICEFHRDVEPIQDVVSLWRNLLMDSRKPASPSVRTVTEVASLTPQCRSARPTAFTASEPPLCTKPLPNG